MGARYLWWNIQSTAWGSVLAIHDEEHDDRWQPATWYHYHLRNIGAEYYQNPFYRLWPTTRFASGDPVNGIDYMFGQDVNDGGAWDAWLAHYGGTWRPGYVQGQCVQADGVTPLATCEVSLYLTSTNALVSTGFSDQNGYYSLPTPYAGQNHFIWANYGPDVLVGASVDTLTPNF